MTYKQLVVQGPFKGIWDATPRPNTPNESFDDAVNVFFRKGRLQSRPRLDTFTAPPDGKIVRNMMTFADASGDYHTLVLTTHTAYYLSAGGTYTPIDMPDELEATDLSGTNLPFALAPLNGRIYFANGSLPLLYCDGNDQLGVAGDVQGSCRFLTVNANHLIAAFVTEPAPGEAGSSLYGTRVRWCKSGDPDDWTAETSGLNDLVEVPDQISGLTTLGRNTFVARTNGFTMMCPTGVGTAPFLFEQFNYAPRGVGNRFPYSLATYGNIAVFVSADDIYRFDGAALAPIGGNCKKKIFEQLAQASGDQVMGWIIPRIGVGYDFLSYWLSIPGVNYTWVCNIEEGAWTKVYSSAGRLTCLANVSTD